MTIIEIGGLLIVVVVGLMARPDALPDIAHTVLPDPEPGVWLGVLSAGLIAFFAFIGFEGIVNVAEEVKEPTVTLRRAIYLTLIIATILYLAVAAVSVVIVPPRRRSPSSSSARPAPRRVGSASLPSSPPSTASSCK
jgi:amino acid transporter